MRNFSLPRNPKKMSDSIEITDKLVAKRDLWIIVPSRYKSIDMLTFNKKLELVGVFYLSDGKYYSVSRIASTFEFEPDIVSEFTHNDVKYTELFFKKGTIMSHTNRVLKLRGSMFGMLQEFIIRGKLPKFLTITDLLETLRKGGVYVDKRFGNGGKVLEAVLAAISRSVENPEIYSRSLYGDVPTVIKGLSDMAYGYNNTPSKIVHNFFKKGLTDVLANEPKVGTKQDNILRGEYE